MGVFEDFVVNVKSAADAMGKKTEQIIDLSKLKLNQTEINNKVTKCFERLGKLVYEASKNEIGAEEQISECKSEIDDLLVQLRAVTEQIALVKNKKKCRKCGADNLPEMRFCGKCGAKLGDEIPVEEPKPVSESEQAEAAEPIHSEEAASE